jgi:guanyl-specific ribonuclease Sa
MNLVKTVQFVLFSILIALTVQACQSTTSESSTTTARNTQKTSTATQPTEIKHEVKPAPPVSTPKPHVPQIVLPTSITPKGNNTISLKELPDEAKTTLALIKKGGPFPYPKKDGSEFKNREKRLPKQQSGYYKEYTVPTPNSSDRGARRIIVGEKGEMYYTDNHYKNFRFISSK